MVGSFNQSTRNSRSVSIMAISFKGFRVVGMIVGLCLFPLSLCCHMIEEVIWHIRFLSENKVAKNMAITQQFFQIFGSKIVLTSCHLCEGFSNCQKFFVLQRCHRLRGYIYPDEKPEDTLGHILNPRGRMVGIGFLPG